MENSMRYLSHNLYYVTDREAGKLAKASKKGRLPKPGYDILVMAYTGKGVWFEGWLKRTKLTMLDKIKNKRGWVWTLYPISDR